MAELERTHFHVYRIEVDAARLQTWCRQRQLPMSRASREHYAAEKARALYIRDRRIAGLRTIRRIWLAVLLAGVVLTYDLGPDAPKGSHRQKILREQARHAQLLVFLGSDGRVSRIKLSGRATARPRRLFDPYSWLHDPSSKIDMATAFGSTECSRGKRSGRSPGCSASRARRRATSARPGSSGSPATPWPDSACTIALGKPPRAAASS